MRKLILTLALLGTFGAGSAGAQVYRQDNRRAADRVCVYENNNYGGWEQCFSAGEQIGDLGSHGNKISSIRVFGNARVNVFTDKNFRGTSFLVASNTGDLAQVRLQGPFNLTWNDHIQSLEVLPASSTARNDDRYDPRYDPRSDPRYDPRNDPRYDPRYDTRNDPRNDRADDRNRRTGVCVYENTNYRGRYECFERGEEIADLARAGNFNDRISSIRVFGATRVTLYRDIYYRGERVSIDRDTPDLRQVRSGSINWDNQVSSLDLNNARGRALGRNSSY